MPLYSLHFVVLRFVQNEWGVTIFLRGIARTNVSFGVKGDLYLGRKAESQKTNQKSRWHGNQLHSAETVDYLLLSAKASILP